MSQSLKLSIKGLSHFKERFYNLINFPEHRNEPYPHKLSPSKPSRSMKRQDSKDTNSQDEDKAESARRTPTVIPYNRALPLSSPTRSLGSGSGESDHAPQISERAAALKRDHDDEEEEKRIKVKFEGSQGDTDEAPEEKDEHGRRRKSRHQHYKQRKHSLSDKQTGGVPESGGRRVSVQPEDATLDVSFFFLSKMYPFNSILGKLQPLSPPKCLLILSDHKNTPKFFPASEENVAR